MTPWSPFSGAPKGTGHPRAVHVGKCPECGREIRVGDRIATVFRPAKGGRKYRGPRDWKHSACPA